MLFGTYSTDGFFDELFEPDGRPRTGAEPLVRKIESLSAGELLRRQQDAERTLLQLGITFNVYGDGGGIERIFPFDVIPRIVSATEWDRLEAGLKQRVLALNMFIDDVYHEQRIVGDGVVPKEILMSSGAYRPQCHGRRWPHA